MKDSAKQLALQAEEAWTIAWQRFFSPKTELFYDYLSSYEPGKELAHLPTGEEVKRQYPNPCGYSTGMEDCMILGGAMLSVLSDRYDVTQESSLKAEARRVFNGIKACVTVHGKEGFVARGISRTTPAACTSTPPGTRSPTASMAFGATITARSATSRPSWRSGPS
ncbi:hypothetical protein [Verrucomicrobium spinosum]|uniref:hypothetical protein n=1 Tax=Verrucomicrobium spinosum TaxID=2736 RepID=UPI000A5C02B4|nr:hypothetical protein [Verrucomicrobium spinosum]